MQDCARGRPTRRRRQRQHLAVPPTSHRLGLPAPCQVVTSGSLQDWSRCAAERWTGMRLRGRASPSSCQRQLAACSLCLYRTDALLFRGALERASEHMLLTSAGDKTMSWGGAAGMLPFQLGRCKELVTHPLLGKEAISFLGYLEFLELLLRSQRRGMFQGRGKWAHDARFGMWCFGKKGRDWEEGPSTWRSA